ncbi:OsmC family peroxiredoxin [Parashewanella curva]|uniref:OsmC family peroxiredoxin n=1 Tax=Parashewanella curva TaxID=2338552 RepID=A0A3L8PW05_9GAMM|nr:OsmC family protein [Parashewanella curva]RLV59627.1 OsmC family peroxiredoxin [Parashewanella curva]
MTFKISIDWQQQKSDQGEFSREHKIEFGSGQIVNASSAPEYKGNPEMVNPEESLLAALSSCHMLTFLSIAHLKRLPVKSYRDNAQAILGKLETGKLAVTEMILEPEVTFVDGIEVSEEILQKMHDKAHANCFIANSINSKVTVNV